MLILVHGYTAGMEAVKGPESIYAGFIAGMDEAAINKLVKGIKTKEQEIS